MGILLLPYLQIDTTTISNKKTTNQLGSKQITKTGRAIKQTRRLLINITTNKQNKHITINKQDIYRNNGRT